MYNVLGIKIAVVLRLAAVIAIGLNSAFAQSKVQRERQSLYLTVALEENVKVQYLPDGSSIKGDFRKITDVKVSPETKTLKFSPKTIGTATLTVHDKKGRIIYEYLITVRNSNLTKVAREIKALLADIEGIEIKIVNDKVVVDGQVLLPADMNRIYTVVSEYKGQATAFVTISPVAQKKIAEIIEREINNPEISVKAVNDKFILEGAVGDPAEKQRAEIIAKTYVPDIVTKKGEADGLVRPRRSESVINLITVRAAPPPEPGKIIQLVVHYVELQKDYTKGFRFQWTPTLSDDTGVKFNMGAREPGGGIITSLTGTITNLLPKLNWAKEHGHARILQSQSVIVQDGQPGTVKSLTRIPYQIIGPGNQPSTQFEEAGISSIIKPEVLGQNSDSLRLTVDFSLKSLLSVTPSGPLVSNNTVQTVIVVRSGESAAIGGLVSNQSGTDYNKLPKDASENPILSLYASKSFRRNQSQFVVFITPIIKSSASAGSERIKSKFRLRD